MANRLSYKTYTGQPVSVNKIINVLQDQQGQVNAGADISANHWFQEEFRFYISASFGATPFVIYDFIGLESSKKFRKQFIFFYQEQEPRDLKIYSNFDEKQTGYTYCYQEQNLIPDNAKQVAKEIKFLINILKEDNLPTTPAILKLANEALAFMEVNNEK